jgi:hypothetical protein
LEPYSLMLGKNDERVAETAMRKQEQTGLLEF